MKIVVPMAGLGSRFQAVSHTNINYKNPKPFILVKEKPMIQWALESLPFANLPYRPAKTKFVVNPKDFIFICRKDHQDKFQVADKLKNIFSDSITVILIDKVTRGAAETVFKAKKYINSNEEIIVSDSDHYFNGNFLYKKILNKEKNVMGIIPVFRVSDQDAKWSYSLVEKKGKITAVGEKDKKLAAMGAFANIGGYYFAHGRLLVEEIEEMIFKNEMHGSEGQEEFYVAPIFDRLIKKNLKVIAAITPKVWGLGTPSDLEYFIKNYKK